MAIQKIKLDLGTVYQKEEGGIYYFRYQVNGARKAISLKTRNQKEALKEANKQIPLLKATSAEIIAAHVKHARGLITPEKNLLLSEAWYRRTSVQTVFCKRKQHPNCTIEDIRAQHRATFPFYKPERQKHGGNHAEPACQRIGFSPMPGLWKCLPSEWKYLPASQGTPHQYSPDTESRPVPLRLEMRYISANNANIGRRPFRFSFH